MFKNFRGFDHEDVLKPGTPIRVTRSATETDDEYSYYALIQFSSPTKMQIVQPTGMKMDIFIDDVDNGKYKIETLKFEEVK